MGLGDASSAWYGKHVSFKTEATLRIVVQTLLGFALSFAHLPRAIPPATASLVGILPATLAVSLP